MSEESKTPASEYDWEGLAEEIKKMNLPATMIATIPQEDACRAIASENSLGIEVIKRGLGVEHPKSLYYSSSIKDPLKEAEELRQKEMEQLLTLGAVIHKSCLDRRKQALEMKRVFEYSRLLEPLTRQLQFIGRYSEKEQAFVDALWLHEPVGIYAGPENAKFMVGVAHSFSVHIEGEKTLRVSARMAMYSWSSDHTSVTVDHVIHEDGSIQINRLLCEYNEEPDKNANLD